MDRYVYTVVAFHGSSHGDVASLILVSSDEEQAVSVFKTVETLGITFDHRSEHYIELYYTCLGQVLTHADHKISHNRSEILLAWRKKQPFGWSVEWFDRDAKARYSK